MRQHEKGEKPAKEAHQHGENRWYRLTMRKDKRKKATENTKEIPCRFTQSKRQKAQ